MPPIESTPWYRIPAVWLVIAIPALTVAGCLLTIVLAIQNPDPIVSELESAADHAMETRRA